jgi:hypothetical protein
MQTAKVYPLTPRADWKVPDWVRLNKGDFTPLPWETNIKYWQVLKEIIDLEPAADDRDSRTRCRRRQRADARPVVRRSRRRSGGLARFAPF